MRPFRAVTRSCQPNRTWADYMYSHARRTDDIPARTCTVYFATQMNGAHYRCSQAEDGNDDVISSVVASSNGICVSTFIFGCLPCGTGKHPNINVETQIPLELL